MGSLVVVLCCIYCSGSLQCLYVLAARVLGKGQINLLKLLLKGCSLDLELLNPLVPLCFSQESRDGRVDSWRNFQANTKGKKEKKNRTFLRPPKVKMEQRE